MTQIITNSNGGGGSSSSGDMKKSVYDPQNIESDAFDYNNFTNTPDLSGYQTKGNLVTDLNNPDDTHYPSAKAVKDAITAGGNGDVSGPNSSVDGHLAVFDGTTGKVIKDGGAIPTPTTVVDDLTTQSATSALSANQGYVLDGKISTINDKIPSEATSSNKLADKNYVNDGINSVTAYYITKNANGDQFATYAELSAATTFYSGGTQRTPTRNDYTIVLADENHDNATTRYIYNVSWEYQYTVNETALSTAQLNALNSGITAAKVTTYDGYASTISGKQDTLVSGTNIKTINGTSVLGTGDIVTPNTTYTAGTNINIDANNEISATDTTYTAGTGLALNGTEFSNAGVTSVNGSTGAVTGLQTTANLKTDLTDNSDSYYPSQKAVKTAVDAKQDTLVSGTNIKTINGTSVLGSGDITIQSGTDYSWVTKTPGINYQDMQGPCDSGFHVPLSSEWQGVKTIMDGLSLTTGDSWRINLHIPFAGFRDYSDASIYFQGSSGSYWSSSPWGSDKPFSVRYLSMTSNNLNADSYTARAGGASVRAFKDTYVSPDIGWTVIQGTLGSAGIFWDTVNGLISITGDGTTGYTIQDKNLGATTVYNDGDTLSENNCGKYYQWGNNYGFAWTGSVTTSSTQVDASAYGPGNYYNSSTFITGNYDWSSVQNDNIRGGDTIGVELSLRTIVNIPGSDFTLTAPATLSEGEEYVIRIISEDNYTMTLGTGFTNPRNVDTSLSNYATDQFVFLAVGGVLELQPLVATGE